MIITLCDRLGELNMSKRIKRFCCCWALALGSQWLLVNVLLRGFTCRLRLEDWISYSLSPGYAIMNVIGVGWSGPMPISDGRWICGTAALFGCSFVALLQRNLKVNFALNILFLVIHLVGCVFSFVNMAGAVT